METICLMCGDIGFRETLVFCNGCQLYGLHRYCLDGPVIFVEDVIWFCEDCEEKDIETSLDQYTTITIASGTSDSINLSEVTSKARRELRNCIKRVKESDQLQQEKIEEMQKEREVISGCLSNSKVLLSDSPSPPQHEETQCSNNVEEESMSQNECEPVPRAAANSNSRSNSVQISQVFEESERHVDAEPIPDPIWRGSFNFYNKSIGTVTGLVAHLSTLARSKVLEETALLPDELFADLLQRSEVWPKRFKNIGPTDQSIALYFFPENERDEKVYDKLLDDLIHLELAIKVVAENAELLIFSSTVLPIQYRRYQAKYYLWGVFRGKKTSEKTNDVVCRDDTRVDKPLT